MKYTELTTEQKRKKMQNSYGAVNRYREKNYDVLSITIKKDGTDGVTLEQIKHAASVSNKSVNKLLIELIANNI